jgi:hypothetical protein
MSFHTPEQRPSGEFDTADRGDDDNSDDNTEDGDNGVEEDGGSNGQPRPSFSGVKPTMFSFSTPGINLRATRPPSAEPTLADRYRSDEPAADSSEPAPSADDQSGAAPFQFTAATKPVQRSRRTTPRKTPSRKFNTPKKPSEPAATFVPRPDARIRKDDDGAGEPSPAPATPVFQFGAKNGSASTSTGTSSGFKFETPSSKQEDSEDHTDGYEDADERMSAEMSVETGSGMTPQNGTPAGVGSHPRTAFVFTGTPEPQSGPRVRTSRRRRSKSKTPHKASRPEPAFGM